MSDLLGDLVALVVGSLVRRLSERLGIVWRADGTRRRQMGPDEPAAADVSAWLLGPLSDPGSRLWSGATLEITPSSVWVRPAGRPYDLSRAEVLNQRAPGWFGRDRALPRRSRVLALRTRPGEWIEVAVQIKKVETVLWGIRDFKTKLEAAGKAAGEAQ